MAKSSSSKLKSHKAGAAWRMAQDGANYKDIAEAVGHTVTAVKAYVVRRYKGEANILWSAEIRAVGQCEIDGCHNTDLNAHHILGKGAYPHLRFDLSNGVCLCSGHHTFDSNICPHGTLPAMEGFLEWLIANRQGQYQWYMENKDDRRMVDMNYEAEYNKLKA